MESSLGFLLLLGIIILAAKAAGYLSVRLNQPAVLGELLVGLLLGPSLLDLFHLEPFAHGNLEETTLHLAEAGVIFLMFMAGIEIDLDEMIKFGLPALLTGTMGVVVPLILGTGAALAFNFAFEAALFVGLTLTATSVSISAQTLMELGVLRSREGLTLLAAAVADDILVILLLSAFLAVAGQDSVGLSGIAMIAISMAAYLLVAIAAGVLLLPRLVRRVSSLPVSESLVAFVIVVTLLYAWSAQAIGQMSSITGAFVVGVLFARTPLRARIEESIHTITYGLLVPIFFVSVGLRANARDLGGDALWLAVAMVVAMVVAAIIGKLAGCSLAARVTGLSNMEALRVGIGMVSRGEVGLIVATVGLEAGMISAQVYEAVVIVVLVTTLLTPIMLRATYQRKEAT